MKIRILISHQSSVIILISIIMFFSCSSTETSYGILRFGQTDSWVTEKIDGNVLTETLVIVPISFDRVMGLKIGRHTKNESVMYFFQAELYGYTWAFVNKITIKVNEITYIMLDYAPKRDVITSRNIREILFLPISEKLLNEFIKCSTFSVELYDKVVLFNDNQLESMINFLKN